MKLVAAWLDWPEVKTLAAAFAQAGFTLRFVGGCVRDTMLGREIHELDAATDALPEQVVALLEAANIRAIPTGIAHGTVTALVGGRSVEITTLRKDVATDGRHAEVAFGTSWEEDAQRRDFTMNALYAGMDGALYDPVHGLEDCKARQVKFIGDAASRIREDYLRILRYFRFVATVGNNQFDEAALSACAANKEGITRLSGERIQQELLKLLAAPETFPALTAMQDCGVLQVIFPAVCLNVSCQRRLASSNSALLKLAALIGDVSSIAAVADRLKLSGKQSKQLAAWLTHAPSIVPGMSELAQKKLVRKLGAEDYQNAVRLAYCLSPSPHAGEDWGGGWSHLAAMANWQPPIFPVTAADLMERGYAEGKALGDTLKELEKSWEESGYQKTREELITLPPLHPPLSH
ncbi:MAG: CCA tRNA nucleotidyltransferase [Alphaproteobacteria bacterium]|nr:CCA tRNA nucleotidyltransferase [Alphaproteobacteria bacterium]